MNTFGSIVSPFALFDKERVNSVSASSQKVSFSFVETLAFRNFCQPLNINYEIPSRSNFFPAINKEREAMRLKFVNNFENIPGYISLTPEGWSFRVYRDYFVTTIHWINQDRLKCAVLELKYFPVPNNQWKTSEHVIDVIKQYNLHTKLVATTSDSGAEMPPAIRNVKDTLNRDYAVRLTADYHVRCVCDIINRPVVNASALIKYEVEKLREMLKICRDNIATRQKFSQLAVILGETDSNRSLPSINVDTKRNPMFTMISKCYDRRLVFASSFNFPEIKDRLQKHSTIDND